MPGAAWSFLKVSVTVMTARIRRSVEDQMVDHPAVPRKVWGPSSTGVRAVRFSLLVHLSLLSGALAP
jgi:hypothetical protein